MDDFIGREFTTQDGSTLKVMESCMTNTNRKVYILECSICSKDEELWPYGSISKDKGGLLKGSFSCGCSKATKWKEWQWVIRVKRECKKRGYIFHGFVEEFQGNTTKLDLENLKTGNRWGSCSIANFFNGKGDPIDYITAQRGDESYRKEFLSLFPEGAHFFRSDRKDYRGKSPYWIYICPICSRDKYVKKGLCTGVFETLSSSLKLGRKSCRCSSAYRGWTKDQKVFDLEEAGLDYLKAYRGRKNYWYVDWVCDKGNINSTLHKEYIDGKRCTCCTASGFNKELPANFYLVKWLCKGVIYLKYGITNKDVEERLYHQKYKTDGGKYEIVYSTYFKSGYNADDLEKLVDHYFRYDCGVGKDIMPDGYTETIPYSEENVNFISSKADWYKKKKEP